MAVVFEFPTTQDRELKRYESMLSPTCNSVFVPEVSAEVASSLAEALHKYFPESKGSATISGEFDKEQIASITAAFEAFYSSQCQIRLEMLGEICKLRTELIVSRHSK